MQTGLIRRYAAAYCLDDGNPLLEGPASGSGAVDEPATAILHSTVAPGGHQRVSKSIRLGRRQSLIRLERSVRLHLEILLWELFLWQC
ncbi:MAG: hypothetical protein IPK98_19600 [Chloracidobacterium sp.]|nr:hypothetical protein [Chloracidobacterium sp.]